MSSCCGKHTRITTLFFLRRMHADSMPWCAFVLMFSFIVSSRAVAGQERPTVHTDSGIVVGERLTFREGDVDAFYGIPYAVPPLGDLRFRKPVPFKSWQGVYHATSKPKPCVQMDINIMEVAPLNYSGSQEDCLYLNIWRSSKLCPAAVKCSKKQAVVVYIHGGAFQWGDSSLFLYDGSNFAASSEVLFVSFNYRVGIFGFLSIERPELPGNMGLWDQSLALEWVRTNIGYFGGDPYQVTLWGQSAGAASVGYHALSPQSRGLFHQIIMQSGTPLLTISMTSHDPVSRFLVLSGAVGCYDASTNWKTEVSSIISCLQRVDARKIINIISEDHPRNQYFIPISGEDFLPIDPFAENAWRELGVKKLLIGRTSNEGTLMVRFLTQSVPQLQNLNDFDYRFLLNVVFSVMLGIPVSAGRDIVSAYFGDYDVQHDNGTVNSIIGEVLGDVMFNCPNKYIGIQAAAQGVDVYMYEFAHRPSFSAWPKNFGVTHADDLPFLLGTLQSIFHNGRISAALPEEVRRHISDISYTQEELAFMDQLVDMVSTFVKDGKPTIPLSDAEWPKYTAENPEFIYLQPNNYTRGFGPKKDRCEYWRPYLLKKKTTTTTTTPTVKTPAGHRPSNPRKTSSKEKTLEGNDISRSSMPAPSAVMHGVLILAALRALI